MDLIKQFIKQEIETNPYYENLEEEYSKKSLEQQHRVVDICYNILMDWYEGYYSVWTVLDTIENYMTTGMTFDEVVEYEDFTIKEI